MHFDYSPKVQALRQRLLDFFEQQIYPNEACFYAEIEANRTAGNAWLPTRVVEELKAEARAAGLWNLFLPESARGAGLSNLEYAPLCEIMGRVPWAPEVFNCNAPDTGNMETLERYGSEAPCLLKRQHAANEDADGHCQSIQEVVAMPSVTSHPA